MHACSFLFLFLSLADIDILGHFTRAPYTLLPFKNIWTKMIPLDRSKAIGLNPNDHIYTINFKESLPFSSFLYYVQSIFDCSFYVKIGVPLTIYGLLRSYFHFFMILS